MLEASKGDGEMFKDFLMIKMGKFIFDSQAYLILISVDWVFAKVLNSLKNS